MRQTVRLTGLKKWENTDTISGQQITGFSAIDLDGVIHSLDVYIIYVWYLELKQSVPTLKLMPDLNSWAHKFEV